MYDKNKGIFEYAKEISNSQMMCFYDAYKVLLDGIDCIVCLESASDLQGFSNGGFRNKIYVYSTIKINKPYLKCFIVDNLENIPYIYHKNIRVTPIENSINDMLSRNDTDDQILFETFANYYFTHNCSYDKLNIPKQWLKKQKYIKREEKPIMKNKDIQQEYKVNRNNIYVGEVVRTDKIYRYKGDTDFFRTKPGQLDTGSWFSYRSMLFVPNEEKLSSDLLYQSPSYPILNVTDDETCLDLGEKSIVIRDVCNLAELLEYFGYNKDLTFEDIMRIRKTFFTGRFGMDNSKLFGMEEFIPNNFKKYIQDPDERYELYKKSLNLGSERQFGSIPESELPRELMDVLDERGKGRRSYLGDVESAFKPAKEEGPIKKLTRFERRV